MRSNRNRLALLTFRAFLLVAATAAPVHAAISVAFVIKDDEIGNHFGNRAQVQQDLATAVASSLNNDPELRFWSFAADMKFPQLHIVLAKSDGTWRYDVELQASARQVVKPWRITWQTEADVDRIGGFPPVSQLTRAIHDGFEEHFIIPHHVDLFEALSNIPLASSVHLDSTRRDQAVLPLDWAQFSELGFSDFKIAFQTNGGVLVVSGSGVGGGLSYPSPPPAQGIAVRLISCDVGGGRTEAIDSHLPAIRAGRPLGVFLTRVNPLGGTLNPTGTSLPPPTIAQH